MSADKRNKGQGPRLRTYTPYYTQIHTHTGPCHGQKAPRGRVLGSWAHGATSDGSPRLGTTQAAVAGILSMCVSIWDEEG